MPQEDVEKEEVTMEGLLEVRGTGVVGRWQQYRFRLDGTVLEHYDAEDSEYTQVRETTGVRDMLFLTLDLGRCEISFQAGGQQVRLRAQSEEEAQAWHDAFLMVLGRHVKPQPQLPDKAVPTRGGKDEAPAWAKKIKSKKSVTTPSERMGSKESLVSKTTVASNRSTVMLNEGGDDEMDPVDCLEAIAQLLKNKQLRVADLFRNPTYNPSYLKTHDEQLDANEIVVVFARAGLTLPVKTCKSLVKLLDDSGDMLIDMSELEAAIRAHKRGKEIWDVRAETPKVKAKKSQLDFERRAMSEVDHTGPTWAAPTLEAIQKLMDEKQLRITDLFRHPHYNPSYLEKGDESMEAGEMQRILAKAGCELPLRDVRNMIDCLDHDGSGTLEIPEFEAAMRKFRRGELKWVEPKPRAEKRQVNMEHINNLHNLHAERQAKRVDMAKRLEAQELEDIEQEKEELRIGTRRDLEHAAYDPVACSERLYAERQELEDKHVRLTQKIEAAEKHKLDSARTRPVRSASDPALLDRNQGFKHIGERLHSMKAQKALQMSQVRQQVEARLISETDRISAEVHARGGVHGDRHEQLYNEAEARRHRREKQQWKNLEAQQTYHAELFVHPVRQALTDLTRIEDLHREHEVRIKKKEMIINEQVQMHKKAIEEAAQKARHSSTSRGAKSKLLQNVPFEKHPAHAAIREQITNRIEKPKGFGSREPRTWLLGNSASQWCMESVDHVLNTVNQTCAARCNCTPEEEQLKCIHDLVEPLKDAMQEFRNAFEESTLKCDGAAYLKNTPSMRLFSNGNLMEDPAGWHNCCEPDQLRQMENDFDTLMGLAEKAQAQLLAEVGPEEGDSSASAEKLGRRWPTGAKWNHPRATKKAQFAYNPGVKPRDVALAKAFVRFGPSEREHRFRHLTDLARCSLVFTDATMLRAGLEQIIERFEVVDVRNWYHTSYQNLLGEKFVEVLVVVQCPEPFICEIRLEEMHFCIARDVVRPKVEAICKAMSHLYAGNGADPLAIEYLASWVLHRPKEAHSVTVFKKHLSRRFGSTVVAWRKAMGGGSQVNFLKFRQACSDIGERHRCTEYWQSLDPTRAGNISVFELDPEAVVLLIKIYWRICGLATAEQLEDPEKLFQRLTSKSVVQLARPGRLEAHEFRRIMKVLGFDNAEADKAFKYLDSHGGEAHQPPATILPSDIAWLRRLNSLVSIECVMMKDSSSSSEMDSLRAMSYAGRTQATDPRRARIPADMTKRLTGGTRGSLTARSTVSITGASRPSLCVRRSSSTGALVALPESQRSQRNSISSRASKDSKMSIVPPVPLTARRASDMDDQVPPVPLTARRASDMDDQKLPDSPGPFSPDPEKATPSTATPSTAPPASPLPEDVPDVPQAVAPKRGSGGTSMSAPISERSTQLASPRPESEEEVSETGAEEFGDDGAEEEVEAEGSVEGEGIEGFGEDASEGGTDVSDTF